MRLKISLCLIALIVMVSGAAFASVTIGNNLTATQTLTAGGGTFNGNLTFTNNNTASAGVIAWSLNLFGGSTVITNFSGSGAGWTDFFAGTNPGNNGSPCNTNGNAGSVCADGFANRALPFTMGVIPGGGGTLVFTFSGTYTGDLTFGDHLQANGCYGPVTSSTGFTTDVSGNGTPSVNCSVDKWAYSDTITTTTTPEPGSLALLSAGLLGLAGLVRRKRA